jgi:hypothetical protein
MLLGNASRPIKKILALRYMMQLITVPYLTSSLLVDKTANGADHEREVFGGSGADGGV